MRPGPLASTLALTAGLAALGLAGLVLSPDPDVRGWAVILAAAALMPGAAALAMLRLAVAQAESARVTTPPSTSRWGDDQPVLPPRHEDRLARATGWMGAVPVAVAAAAAIALLVLRPPYGGAPSAELIPALIALALLFPSILLESLAAEAGAAGLARLLRLPAAVCGAAGLSLLIASMGLAQAWWLQWPAWILTGAVAVECLARAVLHLWLPPATPQVPADSLIAGAVLARVHPLAALADGLRERLGIDLRQSWSMQVLGRAFPWVALAMLAAGWLSTGVSVVPLGSRVVLDTGGTMPVLRAGIHLHAPWPFAVRRYIDDGRVRETLLGQLETPLPRIRVDDDPPAAYDRLWDVAHPAETELLVPSRSGTGGGQGFQVVACDVRVHWRIGSEDADARRAVGGLNDAEALVARAARRALTALCAGRELSRLLGDDRHRLGETLRAAIAADLDRLSGGSGLDIAAVVIDAIHPPVGAAAAYHRVQSAGIDALAEAARGRSAAARVRAQAVIDAVGLVAASTAAAAETGAQAAAESARFGAEREAWAAQPAALGIERWLDAIRRGLANQPVTILDHRLEHGRAPVLDLRQGTPGQP